MIHMFLKWTDVSLDDALGPNVRYVEIFSCFAFTLLENGDSTVVILIHQVWYTYIYLYK